MEKRILGALALTASIHTLAIITPTYTDRVASETPYLHSDARLLPSRDGTERYSYRINPNQTEAGELYSLSEFCSVMDYIATDMGLESYYIKRIDFRFDSFSGHYEDIRKLNKLLILLIGYKGKMKNRYESRDTLTLDPLTVRVQTTRIEAEYYNKREQAPTGRVEYRLELRSKDIPQGQSVSQVADAWHRRLEKSVSLYDEFLTVQNRHLIAQFETERNEKVKSFGEFIRKYEDNIFSRKQLADFYGQLGRPHAQKSANNFFDKNRTVERIERRALEQYVDILHKSMETYLSK